MTWCSFLLLASLCREANVRGALEQFVGMNLPISMTVRYVFQNCNTGLAVAD